jgi:hypothetical protein
MFSFEFYFARSAGSRINRGFEEKPASGLEPLTC